MLDALGAYMLKELLSSLSQGDLVKFTAFLAIFLILWLELRSLKKVIKNLGKNISEGFSAGEQRFEKVEGIQKDHEHRLTMLENQKKGE
jgi:hypothetical protein